MEKLKEIESWMNGIFNKDADMGMHHSVYLNDRVKENIDSLKPNSFLECIKYRGPYNAYPHDVSVREFNGWLEKYPEFKQRWNTVKGFLDEANELSHSTEENNKAIKQIYDDLTINRGDKNIIRLRKKTRHEFKERFELEEADLTAGINEQFKTFKEVYNIEDAYNNYFVDVFGNKLHPSDLVNNTNMVYVMKTGTKTMRLNTSTKAGAQILADLMVYMEYLKSRNSKIADEDRQHYIHFDYTPNVDVTQTEIYKQFDAVWSKWGLIDIVNQKPIIDAMCKIIGFLFTSNRAWRYFVVLESTCSGWGKTAFINSICNNTDLYTHYIPQQNDTDKYSYSEMYEGKDANIIDDPGKNMHVLAGEINNIVSTKRGYVRKIYAQGYTADGVETRIVVTSNIPFRVNQDLMLDNKMICVKTNSVENRNKDEQELICNITNKYINQAPQEEIDNFVSGCVDLLASDPAWISTHLGLHTDEEELGCKIAQLISLQKVNDTFVFDAAAKSLEDIINPELKRYNASDAGYENRYVGFKFAYIDICKELKTKCYEDRCQYTGSLKFMIGRQSKDRCRNFKLTDHVKEIIISALIKCDYEGAKPSEMHTSSFDLVI